MLVHFDDLKREMRRIAAFLGVEVAPDRWPAIETYCRFDWMKAHADRVAPLGGALWDGGGARFINKGTNGRWRDVLSAQESAEYEARAVAELGEECVGWLRGGGSA